jgi:hypothetical protein
VDGSDFECERTMNRCWLDPPGIFIGRRGYGRRERRWLFPVRDSLAVCAWAVREGHWQAENCWLGHPTARPRLVGASVARGDEEMRFFLVNFER